MKKDDIVRHAALFWLILILNLFDGLATLELVRRGAMEWNPLMRLSIAIGADFFLAQKMFIVAVCGIILVVTASSYRLARIALYSLTALMFLLTCLHAVLILFVPFPQ